VGDAADDLRDQEEELAILRYMHKIGECGRFEECPYCTYEGYKEQEEEERKGG